MGYRIWGIRLVSPSGFSFGIQGGVRVEIRGFEFFNWDDSKFMELASCAFCERLPVKCEIFNGSELSVVDRLFVYKLDSGILQNFKLLVIFCSSYPCLTRDALLLDFFVETPSGLRVHSD